MRKLVLVVMSLLLSGAAAQELTVWTPFAESELEWFEAQAAEFENAFGVPVKVIPSELGEIRQQMLLNAPEGEAADLVFPVPHDQIGEMALGGVLADMTSYATAEYLSGLNEQAQLAFSFNGKLFGLPMYVEGPALIINTDLVPETPASLEEMLITAQELNTGDTSGFLYDIGNLYFSYVWIKSGGGYIFARDESGDLIPSDVGLSNEGAVAALDFMKDLRYEYDLIPNGVDSAAADRQFLDGTLGMIYNGPWAIANYRDAGLNLAVAPIPASEDGTTYSGFMGVQGVLMNEFSENKIDAANFAKWLTRASAQLSLAETSGKIPASSGAAADPIIAGFAAALADAEPMPNIPEMGNVWAPIGNALTVILDSPDSDVATELDKAVEQINGN